MNGNTSHKPLDPHLLDYILILRKRKWVVLLSIVLLAAAVTVRNIYMEPVYQATTQMLIEKENPKIVDFKEVLGVDARESDYYQTQYKILKSRTLARAVIEDMQLMNYPEYAVASRYKPDLDTDTPQEEVPSGTVSRFLRNVDIRPIRKSRLVNVSFSSTSPELAAQVANRLTELYIVEDRNVKFRVSQDAADWLKIKLESLREQVTKAEQVLQDYKEQEDIFLDADRRDMINQKLIELNSALTAAKTNRIKAEALYEQVMLNVEDPETMELIPGVIGNPIIQNLKNRYIALQQEYTKLSDTLGDRHPDMIKIKNQKLLLETEIIAEVQKIASGFETEFDIAKAQELALEKELEQQKLDAQEYNRKLIELDELERNAESFRTIYENLLNRSKETIVSSELQSSNIRIVDYAEVPTMPVKPRKILDLLLAIFAGSIMGTVLIFAMEYFDTTLKDPGTLRKILGLSSLGIIPSLEGISSKNPDTSFVPFSDTRNAASEAFRILRTNLQFSRPDGEVRSILVTSANTNEGKTFVALNLARILSQTKKNVLLIEADMRKPSLGRLLNSNIKTGLSEVLASEINITRCILDKSENGNGKLNIILSGKTPSNPSELLGSDRMLSLYNFLKDRYDWIIIDSPPILPVTDSVLISKIVDGVIIVVDTNRTTREILNISKEQLENVGSSIIGVVLNKVNRKKSQYYYQGYGKYYEPEQSK